MLNYTNLSPEVSQRILNDRAKQPESPIAFNEDNTVRRDMERDC